MSYMTFKSNEKTIVATYEKLIKNMSNYKGTETLTSQKSFRKTKKAP